MDRPVYNQLLRLSGNLLRKYTNLMQYPMRTKTEQASEIIPALPHYDYPADCGNN